VPWPKLAFQTVRNGDEVRLAVAGELDLATGPSLEQASITLLREQPGALVLDLRQVTFCDSSGIASLLRIQRATKRTGARLSLHNVQGVVRQVLDLGGVSGFLGIESSPALRPDGLPPPGAAAR
jgi:anti-sigma B factor antagonist